MIIQEKDINLATDVRDTLNAAGGVVNNNLVSFFNADANINKWAKWKPESYEKDFDLSDEDRFKNNYGFDSRSIGFGAPVSELFQNASSGKSWIYVLPKGGKESPYRLGDFRKYNTDATPPYNYKYFMSNGESTTDQYEYDIRVITNDSSELRIEDFAVFADNSVSVDMYYFWIARIKNGNNYEYIISSTVSATDRPTDIVCNITFPKPGSWECIFCVGHNNTDTDSNYIESRTDCLVLPQGYKQFEFIKKVLFVRVDMTYPDPSTYDSQISYQDGILNFGTQIFTFDMVASDITQAIISTIFQFGFQIYLKNEFGQMGPYAEIINTDDDIEYSGTDTISRTIVNFPQIVDLKQYFDENSLKEATQLEIRPTMTRVSGADNAAFFDISTVWYININ